MSAALFDTLTGRVDAACATHISGWAVDRSAVDRAVPISIFVDGRLVARTTCDRPRPDLCQAGTYGNGRHGFHVVFPAPLDLSHPRRITARFSETGTFLLRGEWMLPDGAPPSDPDFMQEPPVDHPMLPAPRIRRDWLDTLSLYDETQGLFALLSELDLNGLSPAGIVRTLLGMDADPPDAALEPGPGVARDVAFDTMMSDAFQTGIMRLVAEAYSEKQRWVFLHIPKCAGTDLSYHLGTRYPALHHSLSRADVTSKVALFQSLRSVVRLLPYFDNIVLLGHISLMDYLRDNLLRRTDRAFTILRDPVDQMISQVNFILTRLSQDAEEGGFALDSRRRLALMNLDLAVSDITPGMLRDLRHAVLHNPLLVQPNAMSQWLGDGKAETALSLMRNCRIEVTDTQRYSAWRRDRWGIDNDTRLNSSEAFLSRSDLTQRDWDMLETATAEDRTLYAEVMAALAASGRASVVMGSGERGWR